MSFDRRLREGLDRASVATPEADVERHLSRVHLRRRHRVRTRRAVGGLVAAALLVGIAVGTPAALQELRRPDNASPAAPPTQLGLEGAYVVDVADSALAEQHRMTGRWVIELSEDGTVAMEPPAAFQSPTSGIS